MCISICIRQFRIQMNALCWWPYLTFAIINFKMSTFFSMIRWKICINPKFIDKWNSNKKWQIFMTPKWNSQFQQKMNIFRVSGMKTWNGNVSEIFYKSSFVSVKIHWIIMKNNRILLTNLTWFWTQCKPLLYNI